MTPQPDQAGQRLDKVLAALCPDLSRARLQALIAEGRVTRAEPPGRTIEDGNYRVKPGETFVLDLPEAQDPTPKGEAIALAVVHEDRHLIVIDKPAGLVVHPAPGHASGTLVNALIAHCGKSLAGIGGVRRPGIVHRLDKDTSGLLVAAKTEAAMRGLSALFAAHDLDRSYVALVRGCPEPRRGRIETLIGRSPANRQKMAVLAQGGREAVTLYEVEATFGRGAAPHAARLRLDLETGRTHQIRVHLTHIGHPILGDPVYGRGKRLMAASFPAKAAVEAFPRQALHAFRLGFTHPVTGKDLDFESPLPPDMADLARALAEA